MIVAVCDITGHALSRIVVLHIHPVDVVMHRDLPGPDSMHYEHFNCIYFEVFTA